MKRILLYMIDMHIQEKIKKIVADIEVELLHVIHCNDFKNIYFNIIAVEDFIEDATERKRSLFIIKIISSVHLAYL